MDRESKKAIRLKISSLLDERCAGCKYKSAYKSNDFCNNYCEIGRELVHLSSQLERPQDVPEKPLSIPEESFKKGRWSKDEELYLINHFKLFSRNHLAKKLNRSTSDIYNKLYRLKMKKAGGQANVI